MQTVPGRETAAYGFPPPFPRKNPEAGQLSMRESPIMIPVFSRTSEEETGTGIPSDPLLMQTHVTKPDNSIAVSLPTFTERDSAPSLPEKNRSTRDCSVPPEAVSNLYVSAITRIPETTRIAGEIRKRIPLSPAIPASILKFP